MFMNPCIRAELGRQRQRPWDSALMMLCNLREGT